jgi:hypothetical protein
MVSAGAAEMESLGMDEMAGKDAQIRRCKWEKDLTERIAP